MYHLGKVIEVLKPNDKDVIASDNSVQAVLDMWDENVLSFIVSKKLVSKIKAGDIVFVDYRPIKNMNPPIPSHTIIKIIKGKKAQKIWNIYTEMFERRKRKMKEAQQPAVEQSYIG